MSSAARSTRSTSLATPSKGSDRRCRTRSSWSSTSRPPCRVSSAIGLTTAGGSPRAPRCPIAIEYVIAHAGTYELQARCVAALIRKTEILWHLLDSLYAAYVEPGWGPGGARA